MPAGSGRSVAAAVVAWFIVAALAVALLSACGTSAHARPRRPAASTDQLAQVPPGAEFLTVSDRATGRPIPAGFLGLSFEYPAVEAYAGKDPRAVNPVLVQLIRNLTPDQAPNLRIGGDTTDWTWWPVRGAARPGGIRYSLGPTWARVTAALTHALGAQVILGINLEANSQTIAAAEARALVSAIGRGSIQALELGNEPELYGSFSWYRLPNGQHVTGRPPSYDFAAFQGDFSRVGGALPGLSLAGPATGAPRWLPELGQFLSAQPRVKVATLHRYPLQLCFMPAASPMYPSVAHMLSPTASQGLADTVASLAGLAHAHHAELRIDEMNSVSCGAAPGISNAFVSALWALDAVFQMARVGVDGVNIHTFPNATYELFNFTRRHRRWRGYVAPEYYGLEMFAQAAPAGSRLLGLSGALGNVRSWATRAPDGTIHVVLINDYTAQSRTVAARIAGARGAATLERLRGTGIIAHTGETIGGQSFGTATTTGLLTGRSTVDTITPLQGAYVVTLPRASAAMLTIAAAPPA